MESQAIDDRRPCCCWGSAVPCGGRTNRRPKPPASAEDAPKVLEIPQDQITKIEIRRMGAEPVVLVKGDAWKIQAPRKLPADADAVNAIVSTLAVLSSDRLVDEKVTDFAPYGLKTPLLTLVVSRKDGKSHTLHLGDNAPSGSAAYARVDGEQRSSWCPPPRNHALEKTWRDLRDKRLLPFDSEKLTRVELGQGTIEFGKNNANAWTILKPKPLRADNFAAEELVRKLKDAKMEVTNDTEEEATWPAKFAAAKPVGIAKVTDQKGTMQIEVRTGKEKDYYAKSSAVEGVFKTTAELGEGLAKGLGRLPQQEAVRVRLQSAGSRGSEAGRRRPTCSRRPARTGNGTARPIDPGSVQQFVDRLRDLTATEVRRPPPPARRSPSTPPGKRK